MFNKLSPKDREIIVSNSVNKKVLKRLEDKLREEGYAPLFGQTRRRWYRRDNMKID